MTELPSGAVTFLFSDIEGSTRLLKALRDLYPQVLADHRELFRAAVGRQAGHEVNTEGDAFFVAFDSAKRAVLCALEVQQALAAHQWPEDGQVRVRIGIHTGHAVPDQGDYTGMAVHRAARICSAARGGQVLVSSATQNLVEDEEEDLGFTLTDLGERRLKDLDRPVRLFELAAPGLSVPAPVAAVAVPRAVRGLAPALTTFVGRAGAVEEVCGLLETRRLVTVTGPGGVGKTRLAAEVARRAAGRFADGACLVELAAVQEPALVPAAVAAALEIPQIPGLSAAGSLAAALVRQQVLLVLDNCEHIIAAAADLCEMLLSAADDVRILATSQEPLRVPGEARYRLAPLAEQDEAVSLFVDRARRVDPHFALDSESAPVVARLVARLDGMPLAIELAAARVEALGVEQLLDRLDDRFALLASGDRRAAARQRSLAAAVDWSYQLLTGEEQQVFRQLSVFPGPFTLEASKTVAGPGAEAAVLHLVDCSLISPPRPGPDGRSRYLMLETLRAFGASRLAEAGEQLAVAAKLAGYALQVAEQTAARRSRARRAGRRRLADRAVLARLAPDRPDRPRPASRPRLGHGAVRCGAVRPGPGTPPGPGTLPGLA